MAPKLEGCVQAGYPGEQNVKEKNGVKGPARRLQKLLGRPEQFHVRVYAVVCHGLMKLLQQQFPVLFVVLADGDFHNPAPFSPHEPGIFIDFYPKNNTQRRIMQFICDIILI